MSNSTNPRPGGNGVRNGPLPLRGRSGPDNNNPSRRGGHAANGSYAYTYGVPSGSGSNNNSRSDNSRNNRISTADSNADSNYRYEYYRDYQSTPSPASDSGGRANGNNNDNGRGGGNGGSGGSGGSGNSKNEGNGDGRPFRHNVTFSFNLGGSSDSMPQVHIGGFGAGGSNGGGGGIFPGMPSVPFFSSGLFGFPFGGQGFANVSQFG